MYFLQGKLNYAIYIADSSFHREKLHRVMIRWIAPILLVAILASELASKIFGVFSI